ncbi:hypothetical protein RWK44_28230 [Rhizobium sp. 25PS6]|uniref:hypothetical protein n=1 Tax=Rhizobium sp. 25PS6 TaxID=3075622 RepID=UPI0028FDBD3B|nr:hypothetical protein [Rhizobium sp. 25PS6]MDU0364286.1 hypothetical protein [Rhizobium sp. 25PS6]
MPFFVIGLIALLVVFSIAWGKKGGFRSPTSSGQPIDDHPSQQVYSNREPSRRRFTDVTNDPSTWLLLSGIGITACVLGIWSSLGFPLPDFGGTEF